MCQEELGYSARRVFQLRRWLGQLLESRERGAQVGLVEHLAAGGQVALERNNTRYLPLGEETSWRGLMGHVSDDDPEVVQPVHRHDEVRQVRRAIPRRAK